MEIKRRKGMKLFKFISLIIMITLMVSMFSGCNSSVKVSNEKNDALSKVENIEKVKEYLKNNFTEINLEKENEFQDLAILNEDSKEKEIFFTGENHGIKTNELLDMKFLRYFKEKVDFKYYLCELSYSDAYFLNKYLESGDIKILENIYKPLKGTFAWNKESYDHWKKVYEFNKTLPQDRKIQVVGVDIEHQIENALRYMTTVLPSKEAPKEIASKISELNDTWNSIEKINPKKLLNFSEGLRKDLQEKEGIYKNYLGENYFGFKLVNDNILYTNEAYSVNDNEFNKVRDKRIYENFKKVYDNLPKGKYYGQWGLNHIFQKDQAGVKWVATSMNEKGSTLENKVLSIAYIYENCKFMNKTSDRNYSVADINTNNSNVFNDITTKDCAIFKLNGKDSPFSKNLIWITSDNIPKSGVTTDFYQYIILVKNSQATEPLNDRYN
jgi:hypothetical protein